jgi:Flp pilus assembly protein TadD
MSSQSRNSRKATQALHLAFAAALLAGSAAHAADQPRNFELAAFSNTLAGDSLVRGNYEAALQQLAIDEHSLASPATVTTNRCVTLIMMRKFEAAHTACNSAVRAAKLEIVSMPVTMAWARQEYRDYLALAYSNRAVLDYLTNDATAAQADLEKAVSVSPKTELVARNRTVLQSHNAVAQVAVVPKS